MVQKTSRKSVGITLSPEGVERLGRLSKRAHLKKSRFIEELLLQADTKKDVQIQTPKIQSTIKENPVDETLRINNHALEIKNASLEKKLEAIQSIVEL